MKKRIWNHLLYSRGRDFPHNGGYLSLISFVPQKSHWIYLALCTVVIMWARRSSWSFERTPPSLPPLSPLRLSASSTISPVFYSSFFLQWRKLLLLICPGVIWLRGVPERIDRVKSRLLTPPVPKHIHSPPLLTPSFLCQAADTNWHIGGGEEEEGLRSGRRLSCGPMDRSERCVSLWCELQQQKSEHRQLMNCWAIQMIYATDLAGTRDHFVAVELAAEFPLYWIYLGLWWQKLQDTVGVKRKLCTQSLN